MNTYRGSYLLSAVLGSAVVLASASAVLAADMYQGGDLKGGYDVAPVATDRGIYLKGYIGQANPDVGSIFTPDYNNNTFQVFSHDIKSSPLFGLGIGYKHSHWLRLDLTGEYRGDALFVGADRYPGGFGFIPGTNEYTADVKSWLGLANAYWDIVNWCGFTPYIGGGIGFATMSLEGLRDVNVPTNGVAFGADNTRTNFAWALYAGLSYDVSPSLVIDLSYRYADLGEATSGAVIDHLNNFSYDHFHAKDITSNDMLLGVRYKLQRDEPVYAIK
jgi:opacity protein-like surface antigen